MLAGATPAMAQANNITWQNTATGSVSPGLYEFTAGANWVGGIAPTANDTAIFGATTTPALSVNTTPSFLFAQVSGFTFLAGAPAYTFSVTDNNFLQFYGAGIVNGGGLTVTTAGSATQFYMSSSAGSATFVNNTNGVVQFFDVSKAGSANITNNNGGATYFNGSSSAGDATITNNSGGKIGFTSFSTGGNAKLINNAGGTVDFSSTTGPFGPLASPNLTVGSIAGAGNFYLGVNALNVGGNNLDTTVSGVISDCGSGINLCAEFSAAHTGGSLVKVGTGTLTLTGANTYTGGTIVDGGTLNVNSGGSITNTPSGDVYVANAMGSTATMNVSGAGTQVNTQDFVVGRNGTGTFNLLNGATVNNLGAYVGYNTGSVGTLTVDGSTTTFNNNSGGTIVGYGGTGTLNVKNGGTANVSGLSVGQVGTGTVNIDGAGSSLNSTFNGYTHYIGQSGGTGTMNVTNGGLFSVGGTVNLGIGSGIGTLNIMSGGTVDTGDFFMGVSGGTANLNISGTGSVLNAVNFYPNAAGNSTITLGPGGTLNTSSFAFFGGITLIYNISPAGTGLLTAGNSATFGGKLKFTGINAAAATYTLINTNYGISNLPSNLTATNPNIDFGTLRNPVLTYDGLKLFLSVDANLLTALLQPGVTGTPQQIAAAIDAATLAGVTLPSGFNGVFNLSGDALVQALKQLSGQSSSATQQTSADASNSLMGAMFDPNAPGRPAAGAPGSAFASVDDDEALGYAKRRKFTRNERDARSAVTGRNNIYDPRWSVWGSAYGGSTTTTGSATAGTNDVTARVFGFVTGADYNVNARTTVGFALGGGGSNYGVASNLGTGRAEMFQLGLFTKHTMGAAYVTGGLGYTFQNVTTDRTVTVAGIDQLRATFNANTFSVRGEGGYRFATPVVGITPYAALQVTNISLPSYGESVVSGNNTFALNYNAQDTTVVRTELGARFDKSYALQTAMLTLRGRAAWAHDEGNNRNISAAFGSLPGSNFTVNGAVPSKDLALLSAGADIAWLNNVTLSGLFEGQFSDTTTGYGGKGTVRYVW